MTTTAPPVIALDDPASFAAGHPHEQYSWLRQHHPVFWHPERPRSEGAAATGFWAVTRHADVVSVSRDPGTFSSWLGGVMLPESNPALLAGSRLMMLNQDPPEHTAYRRLVSRSFTPRSAAAWTGRIDALARRIVDNVLPRGECELVADVAGEMPSLVIAELMGITADDGRRLYHLTEVMHSADPALTDSERMSAVTEMHAFASATAAAKRAEPADDLATALVNSEIDGQKLSEEQFNWFFLLLVNAGGDTTRNLVAGAVEALLENPDELALLRGDPHRLMPVAIEELMRWVTPVVHMRRTTTAATSLGGERIAAGEKVVMFYGSANRDAGVFANPDRLDLRRSPNPHVGFGGGGPHFCLGAHLARLESAALLREIVTRMHDLGVGGPIERLPSTFIAGPKRVPLTFRAAPAP